MAYQDVRLSKSFVLLDFMYGEPVYKAKQKLPFDISVTQENVANGRHLCRSLLEPCIDAWGPCSVSYGFVPEPIATMALPETRPRPHKWVDRFGAAADVCWHRQCADDVAPIDLCHLVDRADRMPFERLITYAGSEFICMGTKFEEPRYALYENVRVPGGKNYFKTWGKSDTEWFRRKHCKCPEYTEGWMREPNEKIGTWGKYDSHHCRIGRYFMLTDFCRAEHLIEKGLMFVNKAPVPLLGGTGNGFVVSRMLAHVLDPFVEQHGRISVVYGGWWPMPASTYQLDFLVTQGVEAKDIMRLGKHPKVAKLVVTEHKSETLKVSLSLKRQTTEEQALFSQTFDPQEFDPW